MLPNTKQLQQGVKMAEINAGVILAEQRSESTITTSTDFRIAELCALLSACSSYSIYDFRSGSCTQQHLGMKSQSNHSGLLF